MDLQEVGHRIASYSHLYALNAQATDSRAIRKPSPPAGKGWVKIMSYKMKDVVRSMRSCQALG